MELGERRERWEEQDSGGRRAHVGQEGRKKRQREEKLEGEREKQKKVLKVLMCIK